MLLKNGGLVKTIQFKDPAYIGDPINTVKIFNDKEVDEIIILDLNATKDKKGPDYALVKNIASESFMPFCYGGGISSLQEMEKILTSGAEKIALNSITFSNPLLIEEAAKNFGNQSIVVSIDVKKNIFGKHKVYSNSGKHNTDKDPVEHAIEMENRGAGELLVTSIDQEGTSKGYDIDIISKIANAVSIPVIANGGAGEIEDFTKVILKANASAVAASSLFIYYGKHRSVLVTFPEQKILSDKLYSKIL